MNVKDAVERIRLLPGALVDCGFRQGWDAVLKQLNERTGEDQRFFVDADIEHMQNEIAELVQRVAPYDIPHDYIFFLGYYGGLLLEGEHYNVSLLGTGPMVEDWYSSVVSDNALLEVARYGFLTLGSLNFRRHHKYKYQEVTFFLDLAGNIQKGCVIGVGPWGQGALTLLDVLRDIHGHPGRWQKVAGSFTEWLARAAVRKGGVGYV